MSDQRPMNIFIEFSEPPWRKTSYGNFSVSVSEPTAYTHTNQVGGGYRKATFSLAMTEAERDYFIEWGVGLQVTVRAGCGTVAWRGYVNTVDAKLGATDYSIGPFTEVANRVKVTYQTKQYDTNPPIGGSQLETGWAEDKLSQQIYGVREVVVSGGEGNATQMENLRDNYLRDMAYPKKAPRITPYKSDSADAKVTFDCVGAIDLLDKKLYSDESDNTDSAIEALILAILQADPNDIFSIVETFLDASGLTLPSYRDNYDYATLLSLIKDALGYGGSGERYMIGFFAEGRALHYRKVPSDVEYIWDSRSGVVTTPGGTIVGPCLVQPGKWVVVADALPHSPMPAYGIETLRRSPIAFFTESVTYTAPWGLDFETATLSGLAKSLNDFGLGARW